MPQIPEIGESQDSQRDSSRNTHRVLLHDNLDLNFVSDDIPKDLSNQNEVEFETNLQKKDLSISIISNSPSLTSSNTFVASKDKQIFPERAQKNCLYKVFFILCTHQLFTTVITLFIIANTIALALNSYPKNMQRDRVADLINQISSWCFLAEMIIKLIGLGFKEYIRDTFNVFDCLLVILSVIDFVLSWIPQVNSSGSDALFAFRGIRLLRVFKLARSWTSLRELLAKIVVTVKDVSTFSVLLLIFMFIFTLLGMEIFGNNIKFDKNNDILDPNYPETASFSPRINFDQFFMGFTTIFIIFIGDDWQTVMHSHYRVGGLVALFFFPLIFVFLNLILLNLILAIILSNFDLNHEKEQNDDKQKNLLFKKIKRIFRPCRKHKIQPIEFDNNDSLKIGQELSDFSNESEDNNNDQNCTNSIQDRVVELSSSQQGLKKLNDRSEKNQNNQGEKKNPSKIQLINQSLDQPKSFVSEASLTNSKQSSILQESNNKIESFQVLKRNETSIPPKLDFNKGVLNQGANGSREVLGLREEDQKIDAMPIECQIRPTMNPSEKKNKPPIKSKTMIDLVGKKRKMSKLQTLHLKQERKKGKNLLQHTDMKMTIAHLKKIELFASQTNRVLIVLQGNSCGLFSPQNPLRRICKTILDFKYYDSIIMGFIVVSTILLALDNPLYDPKGNLAMTLDKIDLFLTIVFTIECAINIIVRGIIMNGPGSYLRESWNILDFLVVCFSLVSSAFSGLNLGVIKIFRMLRVLRPLRMLKRNFGLKVQVVSLLNSIPNIMNLLAITLLFLLLFGIQGVNFFAGKMYYCNTDNIPESVRSKIISEWDCYDYGGDWVKYDSNFDNVGQAMLTFFTIMTMEGWIDVMWQAIDATNIHQVPTRANNPAYIIFFFVFLIFGSLFILNLFVGVVLSSFHLEKDKLSNTKLLTQQQIEYLEVLKKCYIIRPQRKFNYTGNSIRDRCIDIEKHSAFKSIVLISILLNSICLSMNWYGEPKTLTKVMGYANIVFTIFYTIEMVIKIIAFGKNYFKDGWNIFDFLIVIFAWIGFFAEEVFRVNIGTLTTVVRMFRILRVLKLVKRAKNLQNILQTFMLAIGELANVGALLFLFLFVYAVLGVFLFAEVKLQKDLNKDANFQNFGNALLTLFRITTGENWQEIMYDCARQQDSLFQCVDSQTYDEQQAQGINGCGTPVAIVYFVSFTLIVSLIFLNLFIAIILEGQLNATIQDQVRVGETARMAFVQAWTRYDPEATGMIKIDNLIELIMDLVEEELSMLKKDKKKKLHSQSYVLFNFTERTEMLLFTKLQRNHELTEKEQIMHSKRPLFERKLTQYVARFIGEMKIPLYKKMTECNFHDVLEAFVKSVFQLSQKKNFKDRKTRISDYTRLGKVEELRVLDRIKKESKEYWKLSVIEQELFLEADCEDFQPVINRLENKGNTLEQQIWKLNEVRQLRRKCGLKVKLHLDLDYAGQNVIDSSQLIGGRRIIRHIKEWKERKAIRIKNQEKKLRKQGLSPLVDQNNSGLNSITLITEPNRKYPSVIDQPEMSQHIPLSLELHPSQEVGLGERHEIACSAAIGQIMPQPSNNDALASLSRSDIISQGRQKRNSLSLKPALKKGKKQKKKRQAQMLSLEAPVNLKKRSIKVILDEQTDFNECNQEDDKGTFLTIKTQKSFAVENSNTFGQIEQTLPRRTKTIKDQEMPPYFRTLTPRQEPVLDQSDVNGGMPNATESSLQDKMEQRERNNENEATAPVFKTKRNTLVMSLKQDSMGGEAASIIMSANNSNSKKNSTFQPQDNPKYKSVNSVRHLRNSIQAHGSNRHSRFFPSQNPLNSVPQNRGTKALELHQSKSSENYSNRNKGLYKNSTKFVNIPSKKQRMMSSTDLRKSNLSEPESFRSRDSELQKQREDLKQKISDAYYPTKAKKYIRSSSMRHKRGKSRSPSLKQAHQLN